MSKEDYFRRRQLAQEQLHLDIQKYLGAINTAYREELPEEHAREPMDGQYLGQWGLVMLEHSLDTPPLWVYSTEHFPFHNALHSKRGLFEEAVKITKRNDE